MGAFAAGMDNKGFGSPPKLDIGNRYGNKDDSEGDRLPASDDSFENLQNSRNRGNSRE